MTKDNGLDASYCNLTTGWQISDRFTVSFHILRKEITRNIMWFQSALTVGEQANTIRTMAKAYGHSMHPLFLSGYEEPCGTLLEDDYLKWRFTSVFPYHQSWLAMECKFGGTHKAPCRKPVEWICITDFCISCCNLPAEINIFKKTIKFDCRVLLG